MSTCSRGEWWGDMCVVEVADPKMVFDLMRNLACFTFQFRPTIVSEPFMN